MNANLIIVSLMVISWAVGIITTYIGVVLQATIADRKLKKRTCQALYEELDLNRSYLTRVVPAPGKSNMVLPLPYIFLSGSYMEARNCGLFRELPKKVRDSIEACYSLLQVLNTRTAGTLARETLKFELEPKDGVKGDLVQHIDEVLLELEEFCSNLRVYRII